MTFIKATVSYQYPKLCKYVGFYFAGHGKIDENSRPAFLTVETANNGSLLSIQKDILDFFINIKYVPKRSYMFFFDCCLNDPRSGHDYSPTKKPFAFNLPPQCIVSFATSPGLKSTGNAVTGGLWTSHFCEYLARMAVGHTLTQVLDNTNDAVMKRSEFKQPPQYHSSTGPILFKGKHDHIRG